MIAANPHGVRYPWEEWFQKDSFTLRKGRDYQGTTLGMITMVRVNARRLGVKVSVRMNEEASSLKVVVTR